MVRHIPPVRYEPCRPDGELTFVSVHAVNTLSPLESLLGLLERDGRGFEVLCRWFLENDPEFRAEYERVWLWADWPGRWGPDRGIDLIAQTYSGRVDAVQAKNYGRNHSVTKRDIDTFLSESNRAQHRRAAADRLDRQVARSAREVMAEQEKPVNTCLLSHMRASAVEWPASLAELAPAVAGSGSHASISCGAGRDRAVGPGRRVAWAGDHGMRDRQESDRDLGGRAAGRRARAGARPDDPTASPVCARVAAARRNTAANVAGLQRQGGRRCRGHHPG